MKRNSKDKDSSSPIPQKSLSPVKDGNDPTVEAPKKARLERPLFPRDSLPRKFTVEDGTSHLKIMTWNVAGLRTLVKNNGDNLSDFLRSESPDLLCLQETKLQTEHVPEHEEYFSKLGYKSFWVCSTEKKGYSGTAVLVNNKRVSVNFSESQQSVQSTSEPVSSTAKSTAKPELKQQKLNFGAPAKAAVTIATSSTPAAAITAGASVEKVLHVSYDAPLPGIGSEGRLITVELNSFFLVNCYVPNSGEGLKRLDYRLNEWDPFLRRYLKDLHANKPVILAGDLNVAHLDLDIYNHEAKHIVKQAGLTPQERASFGTMLNEGFVDALRYLHPDATGQFTYWSKRTFAYDSNSGLRLDYFICTPDLMPESTNNGSKDTTAVTTPATLGAGPRLLAYHSCHDHPIVKSSDHCPIAITLKL